MDSQPSPTGEDFALADKLFDELMIKHYEMAQLLAEYRELLDEIQERPWDDERKKLARALPGARYHVSMTFAREQVLKIEAQLGKMFPA